MLAPPVLVGYVAQLISPGIAYKSLEGPLLGTRVGIYQSHCIDHSWQSVFANASADTSAESPHRIPCGGTVEDDSAYRLILYKTPAGSVEQSCTDDEDDVSTLPRDTRRALEKKLLPKHKNKALLYPLGTILEDSLVDIPSDPDCPRDPADQGLDEG